MGTKRKERNLTSSERETLQEDCHLFFVAAAHFDEVSCSQIIRKMISGLRIGDFEDVVSDSFEFVLRRTNFEDYINLEQYEGKTTWELVELSFGWKSWESNSIAQLWVRVLDFFQRTTQQIFQAGAWKAAGGYTNVLVHLAHIYHRNMSQEAKEANKNSLISAFLKEFNSPRELEKVSPVLDDSDWHFFGIPGKHQRSKDGAYLRMFSSYFLDSEQFPSYADEAVHQYFKLSIPSFIILYKSTISEFIGEPENQKDLNGCTNIKTLLELVGKWDIIQYMATLPKHYLDIDRVSYMAGSFPATLSASGYSPFPGYLATFLVELLINPGEFTTISDVLKD